MYGVGCEMLHNFLLGGEIESGLVFLSTIPVHIWTLFYTSRLICLRRFALQGARPFYSLLFFFLHILTARRLRS